MFVQANLTVKLPTQQTWTCLRSAKTSHNHHVWLVACDNCYRFMQGNWGWTKSRKAASEERIITVVTEHLVHV